MLRDLLNEQVVAINQKAKNWEEAIRIAGSILVNTGKCKESYIEAMIDVVKTYGPYIVIEDGIAMPHAKSSLDVNETENLVEQMCSCKEKKEIIKIIEENIAKSKGESECVL